MKRASRPSGQLIHIMAKVATTSILIVPLFIASCVRGAPPSSSAAPVVLPDFFATQVLPDGETERWFSLDRWAAKETSAILDSGTSSVKYVEMSRGQESFEYVTAFLNNAFRPVLGN